MLNPRILLGFVLALAPFFAFGQAATTEKVIGRLGQAVKASAIHSKMSSRSHVYSKVKEFQHLVINSTKSDAWYSVLLVNGRSGFIPASAVAILPYELVTPVKRAGGSQTSRSQTGRSAPSRPTVQTGSPELNQVLNQSFRYIGTPYVWGGNSLTGGIDCSGFVKELWEKMGVNLPRTAREQAKVGKTVERLEDLKAGDRLYFWDRKRGYVGHTGIFLGYAADGGAYFIHSSSNHRGVATDDLRNPKWLKILVGARR
jgi:cell wall-associated NlpC family hydrolase